MNDAKIRVLLMDDDPMQLELMQRTLERDGFEIATTANASGALAALRRFEPHIVLVDLSIPGMSGDALGSFIRAGSNGPARFLLFSASDPSSLRGLAVRVGAHGWLSKSTPIFEVSEKLRALHVAAGHARAPA